VSGDVQLTGDALIGLLLNLSAEQRALPVQVEGCDCAGPAFGIDVGDTDVLITRGELVWDEESDEMVWRAVS
jgi:hypothetical protein